MQNKMNGLLKKIGKNHRIALVILAVLAFGTLLMIPRLIQPTRSDEAYCKVYKQEKSRLANYTGSTYSSLVFDKNLNDLGQFVASFSRLERVAPNEILPEVKTLKQVYAAMQKNPSQTIQAGMSGASAENTVQKWTDDHCQP